jgi:hypothetical protein
MGLPGVSHQGLGGFSTSRPTVISVLSSVNVSDFHRRLKHAPRLVPTGAVHPHDSMLPLATLQLVRAAFSSCRKAS